MTENIGYLNPSQIRAVFNKVLENQGNLTPEIISELAAYYEWDTYTALKCLCCYINCCQALVNGRDLQALCEATAAADSLRERIKQTEDDFRQKCHEYAELSAKYSKSEENLARAKSECSNLKNSLKALKNKISVEQMLSSVR